MQGSLTLDLSRRAPKVSSADIRVRSWLANGLPLVVGVVVALPLLLLLISSFHTATPGQAATYGIRAWTQAFSDGTAVKAFWYTLALGATRTAISLPIALVLAWLVARTNMPGRNIVELLCWTGIFLP